MMGYHAVLVNNDGVVVYIRPSGTKETEKEMLRYWKRGRYGSVWSKSFVAMAPLNFKEGDRVR